MIWNNRMKQTKKETSANECVSITKFLQLAKVTHLPGDGRNYITPPHFLMYSIIQKRRLQRFCF